LPSSTPAAGAWRRRLALKAAVASVRITRRGEDEAMLRDALLLRHGGDDPGPAGRLLVAWRGLDRSAPLSDDAVFHVAETLQLKVDDALRAAIADMQQLAASAQAAPFAAVVTQVGRGCCSPQRERSFLDQSNAHIFFTNFAVFVGVDLGAIFVIARDAERAAQLLR
jgi:hypothetical protein